MLVGLRVGVVAGAVVQAGGEVVPLLGVDGAKLRHGLGGFAGGGTKIIVTHRSAGKADDGVTRAERIVIGEIEHRGDHFALGQITGRAKKHNGAGFRGAAIETSRFVRVLSHGLPQHAGAGEAPENGCTKLYLNTVTSQLRAQLLRVLMMNYVKTQTARAFEIERPIIDKETLPRRTLGDFQGDAEDGFFGLAGAYIAGAEKNEELAAQMKDVDAVLVEL